uniref:WW domain-containing protein n=1 Tax=Opuntia streptacantha TaxID=393608 RepID=A0A7C9D5T7_OPUST
MDNSSAATQESTTNIQAGIFSPAGNQLQCPASCEMEQAPEQPLSPYRIPIKQLETLQVNSQSFRQMDSQLQILSHFNQTSTGNIEQCHDSQSPHRDFVESSAAVRCFDPGMCALSGRDFPEASLHCDWSEHICPDGYKYYYNCVTCESRWEKPEEFPLHEQQSQSLSCAEPLRPSTSEAPSCEKGCQIQAAEDQKQLCDFEKRQLPISCAVEHGHEQMQTETCPLDGPTLTR